MTPSIRFLALLAALMAMTPLAIDAYLPAIPAIGESLSASVHDIELSVSIFLAGFSVGQLLGGPFSDHFGRRPAIFTGLLLFILGSLGIALSMSVQWLWWWRLVQALGGGIVGVNPGAIVRDISRGSDSARNFAHMAVIMMAAPLVAPLLGASILEVASWRWIFWFLLAYGVAVAFMAYFMIPETGRRASERLSTLQRYLLVISHRQALGFLFAGALASAAMFAFITSSPSVYIRYFGVDESVYPLLFGLNVLILIAVNRLNVRLIRRFDVPDLVRAGQGLQVCAGIALVAYLILPTPPVLVPTVLLVMAFIGTQSLIVSNSHACAIEFFPANSGTAAALMGASAFAFGAAAGALAAFFSDGTPLAMGVVMLTCSSSGLALRWVCQRGQWVG